MALDTVRAARLRRRFATLRDRSRAAEERALTGSLLAAEVGTGAAPPSAAPPVDQAQRMFEYGRRHEQAAPWDGRSARTGTITFVAADRVEQYVGAQIWLAYAPGDLEAFFPDLGDQVRIARRNGAVEVERIAPNRLANAAEGSEARSGMTLYFAAELEADEPESTARRVADRYSDGISLEADCVALEIKGGARLELRPLALAVLSAALDAARILEAPPAAGVRLEVTVRSNKAEAALEAERALALSAALLTSEGEALGFDDSGAIFSAAELYGLGVRNETRAEAFAFAAAAAGRLWPSAPRIICERANVLGELAVFSPLAWRADFASLFLQRALEEMADAAERSADPFVPTDGTFVAEEERGEPGALQPLFRLSYETVDVEVAFLDPTASSGELAAWVAGREDVAAMLSGPVHSALVFSLAARDGDSSSDQAQLELIRADAFVTALAAICARRGESLASDAGGTLYDADELIGAVLHRRGLQASWRARVAAALDEAKS